MTDKPKLFIPKRDGGVKVNKREVVEQMVAIVGKKDAMSAFAAIMRRVKALPKERVLTGEEFLDIADEAIEEVFQKRAESRMSKIAGALLRR